MVYRTTNGMVDPKTGDTIILNNEYMEQLTTKDANASTNEQTVHEKIKTFLKLLRVSGDLISMNDLIIKKKPPYRGHIHTAIVNRGLIKFESRGKYRTTKFEVTDELVEDILSECRTSSTASTRRKAKATLEAREEAKKKKAEVVIEKPVVKEVIANPFGMVEFDSIYVEKGSIRFGKYVLDGTFTISRINTDENES